MLKEAIGESSELGNEEEEMIIICALAPRYAKERKSGDQLENKATETPDVKGLVDGSG